MGLTRYPPPGPSLPNMTQCVQLYVDSDCPLADRVRADLRACLAEAQLDWPVTEYRDTDRVSPTLLIEGADVADPLPRGHGCRLDPPTRTQIRAVLDRVREAP